MNLTFFIKFLVLVVNLKGLFYVEATLYGIVLLRFENDIESLQYSYEPRNPRKLGKNIIKYKIIRCNHTSTLMCINHIKEMTGLEKIAENKIFLKIFYGFDDSTTLTEDRIKIFENHKIKDKEIIGNFVFRGNIQLFQIMQMRIEDILVFGYINLDLTTETMNPWISLIFREDTFFISFITRSPESISPLLLNQIKYKSKEFHIVANGFTCSSPYDVDLLIFYYLFMVNRPNDKIYHPCLPLQTTVTLKDITSPFQCFPDIDFKTTITFVGQPDENECYELIKIVTTYPLEYDDATSRPNLYGINVPLAIDTSEKLILDTSLIKSTWLSHNLQSHLRKLRYESCFGPKETIEKLPHKCFQLMFLGHILSNIIPVSGNNWELRDEKPDVNINYIILADPRFGFFIFDKEITTQTYDRAPVVPSFTVMYTSSTTSIVDIYYAHSTSTYEDRPSVLSSSTVIIYTSSIKSIVAKYYTSPTYEEPSVLSSSSVITYTSSTEDHLQISKGMQITIGLIVLFVVALCAGIMVNLIYKINHKKEDDL